MKCNLTIKTKGFTLIELMLVIAIIGTLAAIAILSYNIYIDKAKVMRAIVEITNIQNMITGFELDKGELPGNLTDLDMGNYLDPWGNPYHYFNLTTLTGNGKARRYLAWRPLNTDYDLYSMGKDERTQKQAKANFGRDDIVRAGNGKIVTLGANLGPE